MRASLHLLLGCSLLLAIGCADTPTNESSTSQPIPPVLATDTANVREGLLSYDGAYVRLTDCDRSAVLLSGDFMDSLLVQIKEFKANPTYTAWVIVETNGKETTVPDQGYPIYSAGRVLVVRPGDPCDHGPHVK